MGLCGVHGLPNNADGYCAGCEADPRIGIHICLRCGRRFARHVTQSATLCHRCAIDDVLPAARPVDRPATGPIEVWEPTPAAALIISLGPPLIAAVGVFFHYQHLRTHETAAGWALHTCIPPATVALCGILARFVDSSSASCAGASIRMLLGGVFAVIVTMIAMLLGGAFGGVVGAHVMMMVVFLIHWLFTRSTWDED